MVWRQKRCATSHAMIHRALVDAVAWKYITDNPASNIKPPKRPRTRRKVWKPDQIQVFLMSVQHDRNNAGLVPSNRCSRCVDRRLARIGNLTSRGGFALRDTIRPVGVHLAVAVALDPSIREQLPVEPQELGFVEPLKAFAADPGDHVRVGIVFPVLPRGGIDRWFDGREPLGEELGDGASGRFHDAAAIGLCHRFAAGLPCLFLGVEAALGDPRVFVRRWIPFGTAEPVLPLRTALAYRAFHDATSSRSPAVTT